MSIGVNFYKDVKLIKHGGKYHSWNELRYIDNQDTSWSAGNIIRLANIFEKYTNKELPIVLCEYEDNCLNNLIQPKDMIEYCDKVLNNANNEELEEFGYRIRYIKEMSVKGYYVSYDSE